MTNLETEMRWCRFRRIFVKFIFFQFIERDEWWEWNDGVVFVGFSSKIIFFQFTERDRDINEWKYVLFLDLPFWLVGTCCKVEQKCDATTFASFWCVWARIDVWIRFNLTYFFRVCNFNFLMFTWSDSGSLTNLCAGGRWYMCWFIILYNFGFFVFSSPHWSHDGVVIFAWVLSM